MMHYSVAQLYITDSSWLKKYASEVTKMVESFGGRYLARTGHVLQLEGDENSPSIFLIIEWPSKDSALTFYHSHEYSEYLKMRLLGSHGTHWIVAGEDVAGMAHISTSADPQH